MDKNGIWEAVLEKCKKQISPVLFRCWIKPMVLINISDSTAEIEVKANFEIEHFKAQFGNLLQDALTEIVGYPLEVAYVASPFPQSFDPSDWRQEQSEIIEQYSFDNFCVTPANQSAYDAALEAADHPGTKNPLLIGGGAEQGKRHLTFAIMNRVSEKQPAVNLVYRFAEGYFNEIITDYVNHTNQYREEHAKADFFLLAGMGMIKKSYSVQEELFQLFQKLLSEKKQIVVVSDTTIEDISSDHSELDKLLKAGTIVTILNEGVDNNGC